MSALPAREPLRVAQEPLRVAFVAIARTTFDMPLAQSAADGAVDALRAGGMQVVGSGAELVVDAEGAERAVALLGRELFDLLVLFQASFADSSMALRLSEPAAARGLPLLLWAVPDVRDGGRLRLNSLCGINLAGHSLHLHERRFAYTLAAADDPAALQRVRLLAQAGRARRLLQGARIGVVGEHPAGFDTCRYEPADLHALFGVDVQPVPLVEVLDAAAAADEEARRPFLERAAALAPNLGTLDAAAVRGTAGVHAALSARARQHGWQGVAVRCWPEFFTELGCAACGAMSLLGEDGCPASCEADVNGTVTSLLLQALSGGQAWIADLVSLDPAGDTGVLWHCGLAPGSMADAESGIQATVHSNRKLPLLFEFALRPGRVTLARLHRRSLGSGSEGYALVVGGGEMLPAPRSFGGTSGVIRFDRPVPHVLDVIMGRGLEHHLCLTYGDVGDGLRAFAELVDLPLIELT